MNLKERLASGEEVRVMSMGSLASPKLAEIIGTLGGLHGLWIDQEHSAVPHHEVELILMACRAAGLDAFVRVAPTDYATVMRPMEAGAVGVMIAQVRTLDQVHQAVRWAKYPPQGERGLFMSNFEAGYMTKKPADHIAAANRDRWLCIQIETTEAVACADKIAAIEGVDALFVGPADLACTLGVPGQAMHPRCIEALETVSAAVKASGKSWGVLSRAPEHAVKCRELGCQLFSIVGDMDLIHHGFDRMKELFAPFYP